MKTMKVSGVDYIERKAKSRLNCSGCALYKHDNDTCLTAWKSGSKVFGGNCSDRNVIYIKAPSTKKKHSLLSVKTYQKGMILKAISRNRKSGYTIGEMAAMTNTQKSSISARRNELLKIGALVKGEKRDCKESGVFCETVRKCNG